ncbi:MAG: glycosyltransferase family 4 protein [Opitutaceae bacterium]
MRITIVMGYFLPVPAIAGGATEKIWPRLGELMAAAGHEVTIISRRWPGLANLEKCAGVTHLRLPGWNHTRSLGTNVLLDFRWGLRVLRDLPSGDVVVCNTVTLPIYLRRVKRRSGKVAVVLGRMPKGQNRAYGGVDLVLPTSSAVAEQALRENPSLASRLFQFPNPMDWDLHHSAGRERRGNSTVEIGYIGRIHPEKGLESMLEAGVILSRESTLPDWKMRLVGPVSIPQGGGGEAYRDSLLARFGVQLGSRLSVEGPEFDPNRLAKIYGALHVFCYPSRAAKGEGLSIAPIEAMAAGAVPVASRLECYRDLIHEGENGFQFDQEAGDAPAQLAAIFRRLLVESKVRKTISERAQEKARRFDYRETCRLLLGRFEKLVQAP